MQGNCFFNVVQVDELVYFAVAVTGDIGDDRLPDRRFVEPVYGHDREKVVNRPGVGQGLENAEITVIDIGQGRLYSFKLVRYVLEFADVFRNVHNYVPEYFFGNGAVPQ